MTELTTSHPSTKAGGFLFASFVDILKRKASVWLLILVVFLVKGLVCSPAAAQGIYDLSEQQKKRQEQVEAMKKEKRNRSFSFYGKVIGLDGNPVPDARVLLAKTSYSFMPTKFFDQKQIWVESDGQGQFFLKGKGAKTIEMVRIEKPGYEYHIKHNPNRGIEYRNTIPQDELGFLPMKPLVFKIRKIGKPALVLGANARAKLSLGKLPVFFDLLWQKWGYGENLYSSANSYKGWHPDVKFYFEGGPNNYLVVIEAIDNDTLIIADKQLLYEAPRKGYMPKLVIPLENYEKGAWLKAYVYVKGRDGLFYTRMDIDAALKKFDHEEEFVHLNIDYLTNPNGEGNFEISKELGVQYLKDVSAGKRDPFGYDAKAKAMTLEDNRRLLGY